MYLGSSVGTDENLYCLGIERATCIAESHLTTVGLGICACDMYVCKL